MTTQQWTNTIEPQRSLIDLRLFELWRCRHLVGIFVRRDFVASYKQTILGPVWLIFPPLISTVVFTIIFGNVAQISTDGSPQLLFYMAGIMTLGFFKACIVSSASVFTSQAGLFSKVYFPRLACYEAATVNLFVNSGPAALCCLTRDLPYISFKILVEDEYLASEAVVSNLGFKIGESPPFPTRNQRWVWKDDFYETIYQEFIQLSEAAKGHAIALADS